MLPTEIHPEIISRALHEAQSLVVLTDPRQHDNPIVWVNTPFCRFTGYSREEVIGQNCRFLQGDDLAQPQRTQLREHIARGEPANVVLRNYRKDGTLFYNELYVSPVHEEGAVIYFIGVQNDVTMREEARFVAAERERERALMEAVEEERERLGMDLHDGLGQILAGTRCSVRSESLKMTDRPYSHAFWMAARSCHHSPVTLTSSASSSNNEASFFASRRIHASTQIVATASGRSKACRCSSSGAYSGSSSVSESAIIAGLSSP
jgi:PAS domain S-box-containing protein